MGCAAAALLHVPGHEPQHEAISFGNPLGANLVLKIRSRGQQQEVPCKHDLVSSMLHSVALGSLSLPATDRVQAGLYCVAALREAQ